MHSCGSFASFLCAFLDFFLGFSSLFVTEVPASLLSALLVHACGVLHVSLLFPLPLVSLILDTS